LIPSTRVNRQWAYFLYDFLGFFLVFVSLPWVLVKFIRNPKYGKHLKARLGYFQHELKTTTLRFLLHGVSVGEVKALIPLRKELHAEFPDAEILVSASTESGLETAVKHFGQKSVVPFPLDFPWACRRFFKNIQPTHVILAELEIWPNFLRQASSRDVPVGLVNGRITENSLLGYKKVQRILPQFDKISFFGVQNKAYGKRFEALGVPADEIWITGNLKFDVGLAVDKGQSVWQNLPSDHPVFVFASTHSPEEFEIGAQLAALDVAEKGIWLFFPRHPHRAPTIFSQLKERFKLGDCVLFSEWIPQIPTPPVRCVIVDQFGLLESAYQICVGAFVGGSLMKHGGQNVLEVSAYGRPVVVGPYTENFIDEVHMLAQAGGLRRENNAEGVVKCLLSWADLPDQAAALGGKGRSALFSHQGASQNTLNALQQAGFFKAFPPVHG